MKTTPMLKSVAAAALLIAASLSASAAAPVSNNLGTLAVGSATPFGGGSLPGGFEDVFSFSLPTNGGTAYSVINFSPSFLPPGMFNTLFSSISLYSTKDAIAFNGDDKFLGVATSVPGGGSSLALDFGPSAAGNYYLLVQGITNGPAGGMYTGAISVSAPVAAVPEPETYAMLLAGLGLMGFIARRRKV